MTILLTGSSGYIGSWYLAHLNRKVPEDSVLLLQGKTSPSFISRCRAVNEVELGLYPKPIRTVVHCAALSSQTRCEEQPAHAFDTNVRLTELLVNRAQQDDAHFIFLSTDFVFDGNERLPSQSGYAEKTMPQPHCVYSKTKRSAEELISSLLPLNHTILRLSLVYGPPARTARPSFVQWMHTKILAQQAIKLFHDEWRTPVYIDDVVTAIDFALNYGPHGLLHCGGPERLSRVEMGEILCTITGQPDSFIERTSRNQVSLARRPEDLSLDSRRLWRLSGISPISFKEGTGRSIT